MVLAAAHGHGHIHAPRPEGQHTDAAAGGGVAVRADEGLARGPEALQVQLVADAVARPGEVYAVLSGDGLDIPVVVGVLKAALKSVVVDIRHALFGLHPGDPHGLELKIGHGAGGVLGQSLVDAETHVRTHCHFAAYQVGGNDFLCYSFTHSFCSFIFILAFP